MESNHIPVWWWFLTGGFGGESCFAPATEYIFSEETFCRRNVFQDTPKTQRRETRKDPYCIRHKDVRTIWKPKKTFWKPQRLLFHGDKVVIDDVKSIKPIKKTLSPTPKSWRCWTNFWTCLQKGVSLAISLRLQRFCLFRLHNQFWSRFHLLRQLKASSEHVFVFGWEKTPFRIIVTTKKHVGRSFKLCFEYPMYPMYPIPFRLKPASEEILTLLIEEILHQLICSCIPLFTRFYRSQAVQDFFHQQYLRESCSKEHPLFQSSFPLYLNLAHLARVITTPCHHPSCFFRCFHQKFVEPHSVQKGWQSWLLNLGSSWVSQQWLLLNTTQRFKKVGKFSHQKPRKNTQHTQHPPSFSPGLSLTLVLTWLQNPVAIRASDLGLVNRRGRIKAPICYNSERRFHFARIVQLSHWNPLKASLVEEYVFFAAQLSVNK